LSLPGSRQVSCDIDALAKDGSSETPASINRNNEFLFEDKIEKPKKEKRASKGGKLTSRFGG